MRAGRYVGEGKGTILVGGRLDSLIHDPDLDPARGNLAEPVHDHALEIDLRTHRHQHFLDHELVRILDLHRHRGSVQNSGIEFELSGGSHRGRIEVGTIRHHHFHVAHASRVFHFNGKHDLGPRASGTLVFRIDRLDELLQLGWPQAFAGFRGLARRRLTPRCQGNPCRKDQGGGNCENTHGFGT